MIAETPQTEAPIDNRLISFGGRPKRASERGHDRDRQHQLDERRRPG